MTALIIDEPRLHAVGTPDAQGWWAEFRRIALAGRLRDIQASTDGCVREIRCSDNADARHLLRVMMANGFPRSAVRIVR